MPSINIKWGKNTYDVDVEQDEKLSDFAARLMSLTGVPTDRQKLMNKGKFVKSDADLTTLITQSATTPAKLILMGSAEAAPTEPTKKPVFIEDLANSSVPHADAPLVNQRGLVNLGNTCYLNSTLQAFRAVPELTDSLIKFSQKNQQTGTQSVNQPAKAVTGRLGALMAELEGKSYNQANSPAVNPMAFLTVFRQNFAQFAERSNEGGWAQQDADEALQALIQCMNDALGQAEGAKPADSQSSSSSSSGNQSMIDYLFGGSLETETKCAENDAEPVKKSVEQFRRMRCHIDQKISYLLDGLKGDLSSELEMRSPLLGRTAVWKKTQLINQLPRYLIVQFVRFDWKKDTQKKAKVLKKVEFPLKLDVSELCAPQLRRSLLAARRTLKDESDAKLGLASLNRSKAMVAQASKDKEAAKDSDAMDTSDDLPLTHVDTTGYYDLVAVVTHKGRYADSGHYIGWTRFDAQSDIWQKYDDDVVSEVKSDDIKQLSGGGDWHMAYVLIYKRNDDFVGKSFTKPADTTPAATTTQ